MGNIYSTTFIASSKTLVYPKKKRHKHLAMGYVQRMVTFRINSKLLSQQFFAHCLLNQSIYLSLVPCNVYLQHATYIDIEVRNFTFSFLRWKIVSNRLITFSDRIKSMSCDPSDPFPESKVVNVYESFTLMLISWGKMDQKSTHIFPPLYFSYIIISSNDICHS